jgi:GRASP55/65 PDZ-like domain
MGNSSSSSTNDETTDEYAKFDGIETSGYRVLGVQPDSPASAAGLVSFLDFLVGVNGKLLLGSGEGLEEGDEYDDVDLPALLRENIGKELELCKYPQ